MSVTGIIILVVCFAGPLFPPIIGTIVGTVYDAVTAPARLAGARRTGRAVAPEVVREA